MKQATTVSTIYPINNYVSPSELGQEGRSALTKVFPHDANERNQRRFINLGNI